MQPCKFEKEIIELSGMLQRIDERTKDMQKGMNNFMQWRIAIVVALIGAFGGVVLKFWR